MDKSTHDELFKRLSTFGDPINVVTGSLGQYITDSLNFKAGFTKEKPILGACVQTTANSEIEDDATKLTKTKPSSVFAQMIMESFKLNQLEIDEHIQK